MCRTNRIVQGLTTVRTVCENINESQIITSDDLQSVIRFFFCIQSIFSFIFWHNVDEMMTPSENDFAQNSTDFLVETESDIGRQH